MPGSNNSLPSHDSRSKFSPGGRSPGGRRGKKNNRSASIDNLVALTKYEDVDDLLSHYHDGLQKREI